VSLKFGRGGEEQESFRYPNTFERQSRDSAPRLLVGPSGGHCELALALAESLPEPLRVLYVLVVPRRGEHEAGRYESPDVARQDLVSFLADHRRFLESDGRHHLWIAHPGVGMVVYDRHEVLFAYGPVDAYRDTLVARGLAEGPVEVPAPHWHVYHPEFDDEEATLLGRWKWTRKPLLHADED
jgi:hypothetical protein